MNEAELAYEKIETPEALMIFLDKYIKPGIYGNNDTVYTDLTDNIVFKDKYILRSASDIIKNGYGNCYDQVEIERDWFIKHNYPFDTLFIWFQMPGENNFQTHTYLLYKDGDEICYFEHSDEKNKGIYRFKSYTSAVDFQRKLFIENNKNIDGYSDDLPNNIVIYLYEQPNSGISSSMYIDHIMKSKEIYKNNNFI